MSDWLFWCFSLPFFIFQLLLSCLLLHPLIAASVFGYREYSILQDWGTKSKFALKDHVWCNIPSVWYLKAKHRRELRCVSAIFEWLFVNPIVCLINKMQENSSKIPTIPSWMRYGDAGGLELTVYKHKGEKMSAEQTPAPHQSLRVKQTHTLVQNPHRPSNCVTPKVTDIICWGVRPQSHPRATRGASAVTLWWKDCVRREG